MSWRSIFSSFTLWPFILVLGLCYTAFFIGEQYPVTRFPMYDKFPDHTYYVYVADKTDNPVPIHDLTGINTSKLKKPYDKELNVTRKKLKKRKRELSIEERREAGENALRKLYLSAPVAGQTKLKEMAPLQLRHVWIFSVKGKSVEQAAETIARFTPEE